MSRDVAPWLVALLLTPAAVSASTLTLTWEPSVDPHVSGYLVYVGTASDTYSQTHDTGGSTSWVFTNPTPGQRYCFAVAAYAPGPLVGPRSSEVCGYSDAPPVLLDPGNHTSLVGEAVTLQLVGSDPFGQPVSYTATGLPPGLTLTASTGFISGAAMMAGTYQVTATVTDGTLTDSKTFIWVVESGGIATTPPPSCRSLRQTPRRNSRPSGAGSCSRERQPAAPPSRRSHGSAIGADRVLPLEPRNG
jgi:hypothetical protein